MEYVRKWESWMVGDPESENDPGLQALHVLLISSAKYSPERQLKTTTLTGTIEVFPETT